MRGWKGKQNLFQHTRHNFRISRLETWKKLLEVQSEWGFNWLEESIIIYHASKERMYVCVCTIIIVVKNPFAFFIRIYVD